MTAPGARQPRRRTRATRYTLAGLLALPLVELVVAILVGRAIGAPATMLLLILFSVAGVVVVRRGGAAALRSLSTQTGREPTAGRTPPGGPREAAANGWVLFGGLLLTVPGFVTGLAGILLVVPFTRRLVAPLLGRGAGLVAARLIGAPLLGRMARTRVVPGDVIPGDVIDATDATVVDVQVVPPTAPPAAATPELADRNTDRNGDDPPHPPHPPQDGRRA